MATQIETGFQIFANWQSLIFALGIFLIVYVFRTVIQYFWKGWTVNKFYNEIVLHLAPLVIGGLVALGAKKFPWPGPFAGSASARIFYGAILGMFCGVLYGRVRVWFSGSPIVQGLPAADAVVPPPAADAVAAPPVADAVAAPVNPPATPPKV